MILTKTPLRISFAGGGSDYFHDNLDIDGRVVVTTLNKYIYVLLNKKHGDKIRVPYSETENVDSSNQINHQLIRETLSYFNNKKGIELVTSADIPSSGSELVHGDLLNCGKILHVNWNIKKHLNKVVSSLKIDEIYDIAMKSGAVK